MVDRCPICDREGAGCPTMEVLVRATVSQSEARHIAIAAWRDCRAHAVDWRARALVAEAEVNAWRLTASGWHAEIERLRTVWW